MTTLVKASPEQKEALMKAAKDKGVDCPCCEQLVKVYKRRVNSSMARGLIAMYKEYGTSFGSLQDVRRKHGLLNKEESVMRYWGLIKEQDIKRQDGGRAGFWCVTPLGEQWIKNQTTILRYAHIYNGKCLEIEGKPTTIQNALGKDFNLQELMSGTL